jgi:hypothetical protein
MIKLMQYYLEEGDGIGVDYWIPNHKGVCLTKFYTSSEDVYTYNFTLQQWEDSCLLSDSELTFIPESQVNNYILVVKLIK